MSIKWQEPPVVVRQKHARGYGKWAEIAAELKQHPGEWALVSEGMRGPESAAQVKRGTYAAMPVGEFDAVSRKRPDGKFDIYARYIGGDPR